VNELALFAGAGGGILGGHLLGWRTICAVEHDPYARDVLVARQNDGCLAPFPVWDDVSTFDGRPWRGRVDVVSGGFPCQDISVAGKGEGIDGARSGLWREMARIIREVAPRFVLVENSPALVGRGLGTVLGDLAAMGFDAEWGVLGAHHAGAPHRRDRIWIVANAYPGNAECGQSQRSGIRPAQVGEGTNDHTGGPSERLSNVAHPEGRKDQRRGRGEMDGPESGRQGLHAAADPGGEDVADADEGRRGRRSWPVGQADGRGQSADGGESVCHPYGARLEKRQSQPGNNGEERSATFRTDWWLSEPDVGRVAHGVAARVDRLRCLGNGQVPAVVRLAYGILSRR